MFAASALTTAITGTERVALFLLSGGVGAAAGS